ncbi:unnamed protein product [Rotaria sordida]|uniref:Fibrinogen C-terminal domain-containing protein n=2 Tax=Rotaria sordida TaxID=392033 RepID=A0A813Y1N6_9BILA|nr:unnamed protein product [Rotaria sordida]
MRLKLRTTEYGEFALDNESQNYKLQISQFRSNTSTADDSLSSSWDNASGISFPIYDHDYDNLFYNNCALTYHDGAYIRSPLALQNTARNGLHWNTYGLFYSMKETTMRIRRQHTFAIN